MREVRILHSLPSLSISHARLKSTPSLSSEGHHRHVHRRAAQGRRIAAPWSAQLRPATGAEVVAVASTASCLTGCEPSFSDKDAQGWKRAAFGIMRDAVQE